MKLFKIKDRHMWTFFVLPGTILLVLVLGFPAFQSILYSIYPEGGGSSYTLNNYSILFNDSVFRQVSGNTVLFVILSVASHLLLGLGVALILNKEIFAKPLFRLIALLPWVVPDVVAGIIWRWMFDPVYGAFNDLLIKVGLISTHVQWLSRPKLALPSVIFVNLWRGFPFVMLILLAGLQSIPKVLYEAAEVGRGARGAESLPVRGQARERSFHFDVMVAIHKEIDAGMAYAHLALQVPDAARKAGELPGINEKADVIVGFRLVNAYPALALSGNRVQRDGLDRVLRLPFVPIAP
jgi:ABC-type spermidine/putrescine transport system permease subunit II